MAYADEETAKQTDEGDSSELPLDTKTEQAPESQISTNYQTVNHSIVTRPSQPANFRKSQPLRRMSHKGIHQNANPQLDRSTKATSALHES